MLPVITIDLSLFIELFYRTNVPSDLLKRGMCEIPQVPTSYSVLCTESQNRLRLSQSCDTRWWVSGEWLEIPLEVENSTDITIINRKLS